MKKIIQISIILFFNISYGQTNLSFKNWNHKTLQLLQEQTFKHESIKSDSLRQLFNKLIGTRDSVIMNRTDTNKTDLILVTEIFDFSTNKLFRKELYIDWSHSDSTFVFDSTGYKVQHGSYGNLNPEWMYTKVLNDLYPRCYSFWTGSCIGGLNSDYRKAKKFEKKVNENQSFLENYLKIESYINFRTGKTEIAFFVPVRGKRCVKPVAGMWGPGNKEELILDEYFN